MNRSLSLRLAQLISGMVLLTALVILAVVWNNLSQTVYKNISAGLEGGNKVYEQELSNFQTNTLEKIELMLQNAKLMSILNSDDLNEQQQVLQDINLELEADFVAISDDSNSVSSFTYSADLIFPEDVIQMISGEKQQQSPSALFYTSNNELFWLISSSGGSLNKNKSIIAVYHFDAALLQKLSRTLGMRIVVVHGQKSPTVLSLIEQTVTPEQLASWQLSDNYLGLFNVKVILGIQRLYTKAVPFTVVSNDIAISYITINAERVSTNFIKLLSSIALVSLLAVLLAIAFSMYVVKIITHPLKRMVAYTHSIARGDYSENLYSTKSTTEFTALSDAFNSMRNAIKERETTITRQVQTDPLTELFNRGYLKQVIDQHFTNKHEFQAIGVNINGFRSINDVFGYDTGDACLKLIAQRVKELGGVAARVTGGEIIWLPSQTQSKDDLRQLKSALEHNIEINGSTINLKIVMGILNIPQDASSAEDLYRRMNIVIDEAHSIQTFILYYDREQELRYLRRLSIASELKNTLDKNDGQLSLVYQPKKAMSASESHTTTPYLEALTRWNSPRLGQVAPDEFVSIAEQAGFVKSLSRWVVRSVVRDLLTFSQAGLTFNIAINISADDVLDSTLLTYIESLLSEAGFGNERILLELTERVIVKNPDTAIASLNAFKNAGFKIAIDDFGTGYSSLSYLTKLPIDILKIDRSFVCDLTRDASLQAICNTIINLASDLNMTVVAEGIEDQNSMEILRELGCQWGQGYFICKPLPINKLIVWMQKNPK